VWFEDLQRGWDEIPTIFSSDLSLSWWLFTLFRFFSFLLSCGCAHWKWGLCAGCMWYVSYRVWFYAYACSLDCPSIKCGFLPVFVVPFKSCIVHLGVDDDGTRGLLSG